MYYVRLKDGRRWKVREAVSLAAAINEISMARIAGSIGGRTTIETPYSPNGVRVLADVVQVNSDYTERQPYTKAY